MKLGFIGAGNMGGALIGGIIKSKHLKPCDVYAVDLEVEKCNNLKNAYGITILNDINEICINCDSIILSIKPNMYKYVMETIREACNETSLMQKIIVSIAAGISIDYMEKIFISNVKIVKAMPNTSAMIGESMTGICKNKNVSQKEFDSIVKIFECVGKCKAIDEKLMDIVPGVSASSPAYVYMLIEALADGAVLEGMNRSDAYFFASQAVLGAAKMVLESGKHPGELKDMVCSPGGTTIEAVYSLERDNFRGAVMKAVKECTKKNRILSNIGDQ